MRSVEQPKYFLLWFAIGALATLTIGAFAFFAIAWFVAALALIAAVPEPARHWPYPLGLPTGVATSVLAIVVAY